MNRGSKHRFEALRAPLLISAATIAALTGAFFGVIAPASAGSKTQGPEPVFFTARAIPTRSGENVKFTIFARSAETLSVRVDGDVRQDATPRGLGCAPFSCRKWIVYHIRSSNECYRLSIRAKNVRATMNFKYTVCEPFRNGEV